MRTIFGWSVLLVSLFALPTSEAQTPQGRTPIPIEMMAREPFMSQMQLSPDGAHLAGITSLDGRQRAISIWRTDALNVDPVRIGVSGAAANARVRFDSFQWVSNDRLLVLMSQPVTVGSGAESRIYTGLARIVDITGRRWIEPLGQGGSRSELERFVDKFLNVQLLNQLPDDPEHILMLQATLDETGIYRVNVNNGSGERVALMSENENITGIVDRAGNVRVKQFADFRNGDWVIGYQLRDAGSNEWREHPLLTFTARQRRFFSVVGFDPANEDLLIVLDNEGQTFTYARAYSISQRAFVETMFQDPRHDISNVLIETVDAGQPTQVIGFTYEEDTEHTFYADPTYRALQERLQRALPGRYIHIGSRRGRYRLVMAESSRHPPSYYLMTDDQRIEALGGQIPDFPSDSLVDTQLIRYTARDGLEIPAFLTLPRGWRQGDPPLPVIIQPHGGPWGRNNSSWGGGDIPVTQYFASRGFAVLQPQFRGSTGFGDRLWRAGDREWGQKMQDDKDDGLAYLVQQGIADPNRALIYGFSYGGFAAMAATVRPNPPYRCAISGAGVSSLERLGTLWRQNRLQRQTQGWTVGGMDPLQHASEASIPILIYHGDRDQTATIWHSERFAAALRAAGKPHEFVVIEDMPHGAITPDMRQREFEIVENYIRGPCGIAY
jgi:dipeptidyl aminopeptidase/acylaminoacyl peptidase